MAGLLSELAEPAALLTELNALSTTEVRCAALRCAALPCSVLHCSCAAHGNLHAAALAAVPVCSPLCLLSVSTVTDFPPLNLF